MADSDARLDLKSPWDIELHEGRWVSRNGSADGELNYSEGRAVRDLRRREIYI